jgi:hypothetical protein
VDDENVLKVLGVVSKEARKVAGGGVDPDDVTGEVMLLWVGQDMPEMTRTKARFMVRDAASRLREDALKQRVPSVYSPSQARDMLEEHYVTPRADVTAALERMSEKDNLMLSQYCKEGYRGNASFRRAVSRAISRLSMHLNTVGRGARRHARTNAACAATIENDYEN